MLLIDKQHIFIKDYQMIKKMDDHQMIIHMDNRDLIVYGHDLEIYYYDADEIRIHGQMEVIEYHDHRV